MERTRRTPATRRTPPGMDVSTFRSHTTRRDAGASSLVESSFLSLLSLSPPYIVLNLVPARTSALNDKDSQPAIGPSLRAFLPPSFFHLHPSHCQHAVLHPPRFHLCWPCPCRPFPGARPHPMLRPSGRRSRPSETRGGHRSHDVQGEGETEGPHELKGEGEGFIDV